MHPFALEARRLKPFESMYHRIENSAISRNVNMQLKYEELLPFTKIDKCHYCLKEISWKKTGASTYNLDRKDNDSPYSKDNLVVCCGKCNKGKREIYTYEEWYGMTEYFRRNK